jgi:hypothetical protein
LDIIRKLLKLLCPELNVLGVIDVGLESLPTDEKIIGKSGYLQVFLEGGLNQQRIGVCLLVSTENKLLCSVVALPVKAQLPRIPSAGPYIPCLQ